MVVFTDKKITPQTTNRSLYYAPTHNGYICPNLKVDLDGLPIRVEMDTDEHSSKKMKKCVCKEEAPFCSYHLGTGNIDPNTGLVSDYYCYRYEVWNQDESKPVVDTHQKRLEIQENKLEWV